MTAWFTESHVIAAVGRLTEARLRAFVEAGCVVAAEGEEGRLFAEADLARLELLCELAEDFGLEAEALAMVMSLIDQVHGLRHEMRCLARAVEAEPEGVRARIRATYLREREG